MSTNAHIPFYNPIDPTHARIWPDYKLLMPVCAVGNIGQLACDLIISTLLSRQECQLVGRIYSPALVPVVGPNAFTPLGGPPTTSTEVYESKKHKLVIIQQRTSYFKNLRQVYIREMIQWVKESKFDQLLVLSSSFAQCNPDTSQLGQLNVVPIKTITTSAFEKTAKWQSLNLKSLPDKSSLRVVRDDFLSYLPGSGFTKPLIKACEQAFVPAAFIVDFCSEGINLHDCYQVVSVLDRYLNLCSKPPMSTSVPTDRLSATAADLKAALSDIELGLDGGDDPYSEAIKRAWVEPYSWTQQNC